MEKFIADLVKEFDSGKVDRREFCQTVALAAMAYASGEAANAQAARGFKVLGINHVSYRCPDYIKARDFYSSVLGMKVAPGRETEKRANLMFGPEPGKGGSYVVMRNNAAETKASGRGRSRLLHDFRLGRREHRRGPEGERRRGGRSPGRSQFLRSVQLLRPDCKRRHRKRVPALRENRHGRVRRTQAQ
jgi:catechol 2,3-dioxygenase-like lactoylglutathione lyase family enzyme